MKLQSQKGFAGSLALIVIAIVLIAGAIYFYENRGGASMTPASKAVSSTVPPLVFSQLVNAEVPDTVSDNIDATVNLTNGVYKDSNQTITLDAGASSTAYGDLNADGTSDIATVIGVDTGGSGYFEYLVLYANDNGTPKYITSQFLGDRITINKVYIHDGMVSVDIITQGPNDPMCCATMPKTLDYTLSGTSLIDASSTE